MQVDITTRLSRLLSPRHIVLMGEPAPPGLPGSTIAPQLRCTERLGYTGQIWSLSLSAEESARADYAKTLAELPQIPDLAYVGLSLHAGIDALRALAAVGVAAAICPGKGFDQVGEIGVSLTQMMVRAAGGMPVLGAGSCGLVNYLDSVVLWPEGLRLRPLESGQRGVALVLNAISLARNLHLQRRGLPLACLVSLGDRSVVGSAAMLMALLADERITAIGIQLDDLLDVPALENAMMLAHERRVPVVALVARQMPRQMPGASSADSTDCGRPGRDRILGALLERLGIMVAHTEAQLLETLKLLHGHGVLPNRQVRFVSACCDEALMFHQAAGRAGLQLPDFDPGPHARLTQELESSDPLLGRDESQALPPFDLEELFTPVEMASAPAATDAGEINTPALWILVTSQALQPIGSPADGVSAQCEPDPIHARLIESFVAFGRDAKRATAVLADLFEGMPESAAMRLMRLGVTPLIGIETACSAVALASAAALRVKPEPLLISAAGRRVAASAAPGVSELLTHDEPRLKSQLASFGLGIPPGVICTDAQEAISAMEQLGAPVSLKPVGGPTTVSALRGWSGVRDKTEARHAFEQLAAQGAQVLVEPVFADPLISLRLCLYQDPLVGLHMVIGAAAQSFDDQSTIVLLPASAQRIRQAVNPICQGRPIDTNRPAGHRASGAADARPGAESNQQTSESSNPIDSYPDSLQEQLIGAVVAAALAVQRYAVEHNDRIENLQIDPLVVRPQDMVAYAMNVRLRLCAADEMQDLPKPNQPQT